MRVKLLGKMRTVGESFEMNGYYLSVFAIPNRGYKAQVIGPDRLLNILTRAHPKPRGAAISLERKLSLLRYDVGYLLTRAGIA